MDTRRWYGHHWLKLAMVVGLVACLVGWLKHWADKPDSFTSASPERVLKEPVQRERFERAVEVSALVAYERAGGEWAAEYVKAQNAFDRGDDLEAKERFLKALKLAVLARKQYDVSYDSAETEESRYRLEWFYYDESRDSVHQTLDSLGLVYYRLGDNLLSAAYAKRATELAMGSFDGPYNLHLARALVALGWNREALTALDDSLYWYQECFRRPISEMVELAELYERLGEHDTAASIRDRLRSPIDSDLKDRSKRVVRRGRDHQRGEGQERHVLPEIVLSW